MSGVGIVHYTKNDEPGTLVAEWCHSEYGNGTGVATGGPAKGFEGHYRIIYYDDQGNLQAERELDIKKSGAQYQVSWLNNGDVSAIGIGIETSVGLSVGYRD
ncbi:hypothetical protein [Desulfoluna spongiiphila]|uniref:hypothetical protein n=1 Tax=Desulfoluna spongiiphila TaxID=419481 RepID=UPI0012563955|nr:hypothetical protein [Desulfoluna spongiiphila]VVS91447.1 hypothetical protein DBB_10150 [Desulfoluna spongiiphila]